MQKLIERDEVWGTNWPEAKPGEMVVIRRDGVPVMVEFVCPCGCEQTIPTPLSYPGSKGGPPRWNYIPGKVTIEPSIRWISGCKAHFNITDGKAVFHADSGI